VNQNSSKRFSKSFWPILRMTIQQAFRINNTPLPWTKAIPAGICAGLPPLIGLLLGNFQYGLLAGIGCFTYLYVFNVPYVQRAKKLFWALIGMTLSVGLGTLLAPFPLISAVAVGAIGAIATFIFGSLRISGPAAIFFVLGFAMATGMTVDPSLALLRAGLVFLGGALSWFIGMAGLLFNPHGPEHIAVTKVYKALTHYMDSAGTAGSNEARKRLVSTLKASEETLLAGHLTWRSSEQHKRLLLMNDRANRIFMKIYEQYEDSNTKLPLEIEASIRAIADSIENSNRMNPRPNQLHPEIIIPKPSLTTVFRRSLNKDSIVLFTAIRYGVILTIAAIVAYSFAFNRAYWITLSCAAVMSGATIISTFHRAIQRSIGTIVGILIASAILAVKPEGFVIVIAVVMLTILTELAIVLNYGLAALFITPNALLLAESAAPLHNVSYFATARVIDVLIGSAIGLAGTLMIGRRQASGLLPSLLARTIRSEQQFLRLLFSEPRNSADLNHSLERNNMQTNLTNLNLVYTTALGEIPSNRAALEALRPVLFSIEQLGFLLESSHKYENRPTLSADNLSQILLVFETMADAVEHRRPFASINVPEIKGFSKINKEIQDLQDAITVTLSPPPPSEKANP